MKIALRKGVILIETCLVCSLLLGALYFAHLAVIKHGLQDLEEIQKMKFSYDGAKKCGFYLKAM